MSSFFQLIVARRGLVLALTALLAVGGVMDLRALPIDAVPDISPEQVMVLTQAKELGPLEAERLVTFPIENAMAGVPGLKSIRSTSRFGLSAVYVTFDGTDVDARVKLPPGHAIAWNGQFENMRAADERLTVVVPVAIAAVSLLLLLMFDDLRLASLVFLLVPVSVSGGVTALAARGLPFSISAVIGFIATFGIAILHGVVLASTLKTERARGCTAAERRLRPVLATASVADLGFLPMAVSTGAGAEVQRPLATVGIGGLTIATALTLLVLPTLYPLADRLLRPRRGVQARPPLEVAAE
ncbi:MAG: efflux RND transporter permease subunit [Caulobacteraceae bacterium]|nr:efflux RND transporter permease subunit [Caulobacter sp.]